ncbi:WD40-repeat-containing domain protein [Collybia nuda]|uniref:WD40-repeat-containing domain protein n=1 Tax=Collybia nuda TaxID=64659 RepID=A0A9P5Y197_9AGAR|nr:WD40-repeat-containing domain protein [Collybia nuda]
MIEPSTVSVHRCRFVDYTPSAITALAFPPLVLPSTKGKATTSRKQLRFGTLAVGHANGNIDLCEWAGGDHDLQSSQAWVIRKTLPGLHPSKVDSLTLVIRYPDDFTPNDVPACADLRLFSSGGGSELLEWDMARSSVRRTISSQGGSIWCMAANASSDLLALGCEDGTIRLISIKNDTLTHYRRFDRVKCRVLSIAWGPPRPRQRTKPDFIHDNESSDEDDSDGWDDIWLVTGGSDSSIRKWDFKTGRVVDRMGTDKIRGERTLVWTVGVLGDGTIVSGDSLGMVKFWESRTCTLLQSFQGHSADVLCLTISPEGKSVMTSGVDQKTVQFSLVKTVTSEQWGNSSSSSSSRWVQSCSRRMHSHDVRALATWPPYTPLPVPYKAQFLMDVAPIIASGGLDMSVVLTPAALPSTTIVKIINPLLTSTHCTFEDSYHRRLAYTIGPSCTSAVQVTRSTRLVYCLHDTGLSIWRIPLKSLSTVNDDTRTLPNDTNTPDWVKVLEMELNVHTNLIASRISDDGRWLAISDLYEVKLFSLKTDGDGQLNPKRIRDFSSILRAQLPEPIVSTGATALRFTPDSSKLVISTTMTSYIVIIDLSGERPRVLRTFDHHRMPDSIIRNRLVKGRVINNDIEMGDDLTKEDDNQDRDPTVASEVVSVTRMSVSPDGQWLVTSDDRAQTHVYNLDSLQHHSVLPSFVKPAQFLSFDPAHPSILIMAFPDNTLQFYNVESRQFPPWAKELCDNLPKRFTHAHDPVLGVTFEPVTSAHPKLNMRHALFWGSTWMCKILLNYSTSGGHTKKRRRETTNTSALPLPPTEEAAAEFKMITHYRPILFVDFLNSGELVVVERPLVDVLSTLPPAYFKQKYGAS